jgi:hypothetical protein
VCGGKCCGGEKFDLSISACLHDLFPPEYQKWFLGCSVSVYMSVGMRTSIAPERLGGFYSYSVFKSLSVIHCCRSVGRYSSLEDSSHGVIICRRLVSAEYKIAAKKIGVHQISHKI